MTGESARWCELGTCLSGIRPRSRTGERRGKQVMLGAGSAMGCRPGGVSSAVPHPIGFGSAKSQATRRAKGKKTR